MRYDPARKHVTQADGYAVVAITLTIQLDTQDGPIQVPLRWTVSFVRRSGQWRWLQTHASSATASQKEGAAYPASGIGD